MMLPHGPDREAFDHAKQFGIESRSKLTGTMAFMFETRYPQRITTHAAKILDAAGRYADCWKGLEKRFDPSKREVCFSSPLVGEGARMSAANSRR